MEVMYLMAVAGVVIVASRWRQLATLRGGTPTVPGKTRKFFREPPKSEMEPFCSVKIEN
jgi:hypothetical protein